MCMPFMCMTKLRLIMFAVAPISVSPPFSSVLSMKSAVVDSMVMRSSRNNLILWVAGPSGSSAALFFRPTKWLGSPLLLSPNKLNALSALPSSKDSDPWLDPEFRKVYDKPFNYDLGKESDFGTISLPFEVVSIFIKRLLTDTDTGTIRIQITVIYGERYKQVFASRYTKPPTAEDGSRDCQGAFDFESKIKHLLWGMYPKPQSIEIKVMSRESQLCLIEASSY